MRLFGERIPPISSVKAYIGHTTSAAGSIEAIVSLLALEHNFLPVNLNFRNQIKEHSQRLGMHIGQRRRHRNAEDRGVRFQDLG